MKVTLPEFERAGVLVVGDVMLDRYWYGPTSRISPEAPVPVVKVENIEERPGGAANVAMAFSASRVSARCASVHVRSSCHTSKGAPSLLTTTGGQRESSRVILPSMASWMHWSKSGCSSTCTSGFIQ